MNGHLEREELLAFLQGRLSGPRVAAVAEHLERCDVCGEQAWQAKGDRQEHPFVDTTLTAYVDGTLSAKEIAAVEEHLRGCARCSEDVADLRATAVAIRPAPRRWWIAAAVILVLIAAAALLLRTPKQPAGVVITKTLPPPPETTTTTHPAPEAPRDPYAAIVADALRDGALAMPAALADLQVAADPQRAPSDDRAQKLMPAGVIVDTTRPQFTWPDTRGATYVLSLFDGTELIMESLELARTSWRPKRDLARGRTYQWQVEVRTIDKKTILPAPPAPLALFRVLAARAHAELEDARKAHPDDPLLLGVLYARHGLRAEAVRELRRVNTDEGRKLLRSVEAWPR